MSDGTLNYAELLKAFTECVSKPDIVDYEIDQDGVVYLLGSHGQVTGMTSREGLQYLLDNAPRAKT